MTEFNSFANRNKASSFANLRDTLAALFDKSKDIERISADAGLNCYGINFSSSVINVWHDVLAQAEKEAKTDDLMLVTFKEFQKNERLIKAWHDFLRQKPDVPPKQPTYGVWFAVAALILVIGSATIFYFERMQPLGATLPETPSVPTMIPVYTPTQTSTESLLASALISTSTPTQMPSTPTFTPTAIPTNTEIPPTPTTTPTLMSTPTVTLTQTSTFTPAPTYTATPAITLTFTPTAAKAIARVSKCQFVKANMPQTQDEIAKKYGVGSDRLALFHEGCDDLITGFVANLGPEIEVKVPAGGCIDAPVEALYTGDHIQNAYNNNDGRRAYTGSVIASVFSYRAWCDELHTPINSRVCIASENTELGVGWVSPPMFVPVTNGSTRTFSHCPPSTEIQYDAIAIDDTLVKVEQVCSDDSRDITSLFESFFVEDELLLHYKSAPMELGADCRIDFTVQDVKGSGIGLMIKASSLAKPTSASSSRVLNQLMVCDSNMEVLERNFQWKGPDTSICMISLDEGEFIVGTADRYGDRVNDPPEGTPCTAFAFVGPLEMQVAMNYGAGGDYHSRVTYEQSKYLMPKQVELDKHTECNKNRRGYETIECRQNACRTLANRLSVDISPTPPLVCSFLDELVPKGEVEKILYGNNGVAGVQTRLNAAVDVPDGWKVHNHGRESKGPIPVEAGTYASFWAPPSCEPLVIPVAYAEQLCPFTVEQGVVDSWKKENADVPTVTSYIDEFNRGRPNDEGGAFRAGTTIPVGVIVATNFDENDLSSADKWSNYPVKPIAHYGSWGLFQTEGEYVAPNAGACRMVVR